MWYNLMAKGAQLQFSCQNFAFKMVKFPHGFKLVR